MSRINTKCREYVGRYSVAFAFMFCCLLVNLPGAALAQEVENSEEMPVWNFIKEVENVRFSYAQAHCESQPYLLLRIENLNATKVFGSWYLKVTNNGATNVYAGALVDVAPMMVKSGSCSNPEPHLAIPQIGDLLKLSVDIDVTLLKP